MQTNNQLNNWDIMSQITVKYQMSNEVASTCFKTSFNEANSNINQQKFKAKRIPYSHKVPFVVMKSTKPLTQTKEVELQTK